MSSGTAGQTTPDGNLTLEFAECLGACEFAPCMLANQTLYKDLTPEPLTLPRLEKSKYVRPPMHEQNFIPEVYR